MFHPRRSAQVTLGAAPQMHPESRQKHGKGLENASEPGHFAGEVLETPPESRISLQVTSRIPQKCAGNASKTAHFPRSPDFP